MRWDGAASTRHRRSCWLDAESRARQCRPGYSSRLGRTLARKTRLCVSHKLSRWKRWGRKSAGLPAVRPWLSGAVTQRREQRATKGRCCRLLAARWPCHWQYSPGLPRTGGVAEQDRPATVAHLWLIAPATACRSGA